MMPERKGGLRPLIGLGLSSGVGAASGYVFGALVEWASEYLGVAPQPAWLKAALGGIGLLLFGAGWLLWYFWPVILGQTEQSGTTRQKDILEEIPLSADSDAILRFLLKRYPQVTREREISEALCLPAAAVRFSLDALAKAGYVCPPKYRLQVPLECSETGFNDHGAWGVLIMEPGVARIRNRGAGGNSGAWKYKSP